MGNVLIAAFLLGGLAVAGPVYAISSTADFGTVTLTQSGTSVLFDVSLNSGNRFVETGAGAGELFLFNDNLAGSTITNITATLNGAAVSIPGGLSGFTSLSPVKAAGNGTFTASVECTLASACKGGSTPNINDLHFTVTNATIAQLETPNSKGNIFVADVLCAKTGCNTAVASFNPASSVTSFSSVASVPEPASLLLLGAGLAGIGMWRRRTTVV